MASEEPYDARAAATRFGVALAAINPEAVKDPGLQAIATQIQALELDLNEFGTVLYAGGDWLYNTSHYLHVAAQEKGVTNEALALFDANLAAFLNSQIEIAGAGDEGFISSSRERLAAFVMEDLGWALANANAELAAPYEVADNRFSATVNDFQDYSRIETALRATLSDPRFAGVHSLIADALAVSEDAWQTIVLGAEHSSNPFDDPSFNPAQAPTTAAELAEGSAQTFTAYLPFEAHAGGQRIRITLGDGAADRLSVLGNEEIEIGADGTFTVTVAEGQREVTFAIAALEDVDNGQTFTLSAQLISVVGGEEVATHLEHEEATLLLDTEEETPPAGGMEFHGEWGWKRYQTLDRDGNPIPGEFHSQTDFRYPHLHNSERDAAAPPATTSVDGVIVGGPWPDHIWTGYQWQTVGAGGDDYIEGWANVPNFISDDGGDPDYGEGGNDVFEGGENAFVHPPDGQSFHGEKIETSGDDIIFGGTGDDEIYADRIALLDQVFDPETPMLDMLGDWIAAGRGDDRVFGSAAHDLLFGGGGADTIHGGAGNDVLDGDDNYHPNNFVFWEIQSSDFGVAFFPVTNLYIGPGYFDYYQDVGGDDLLDGGAGTTCSSACSETTF